MTDKRAPAPTRVLVLLLGLVPHRLARKNGQDALEARDSGLRDTVHVQALLVRRAEVGRTLHVEVEVERTAGRVVICVSVKRVRTVSL